MSSKPSMAPSRPKRSSPEAAVRLLQKKLDVAEKETVSLVSQLAGLGFRTEPAGQGGIPPPVVQPFLPQSVETEALHKNYQALVGRLCRNESQIQTLKLNLCSLQAARDLTRNDARNMKEEVSQLTELHTTEVRKLNQELARSRKELKDAIDARRGAEEETRRLQGALEVATSSKSDIAIGFEDIRIAKQKLLRRVSELKEELAREISFRSSLEDSHATLLQRIQEMEATMESDRREVQSMNENCIELRHEGARLFEEKKQELARNKSLEEAVKNLRSELSCKDENLKELHEQNKNIVTSLASTKKACSELHIEVERQAKLVIDTQTLLVQVQSEREALQDIVQKSQQSPGMTGQKSEDEHQAALADVQMKLNLAETQRQDLETRLTRERESKQTTQTANSKLEEQLLAAKLKLSEFGNKHQTDVASLESALAQVKDELRQASLEKDAAMRSKETLLDEVNQAVDSMAAERQSVQQKISKAQTDIESLTRERDLKGQEISQLRERIAVLEQHQTAHEKVEATISDLLESKSRLAYEKGQLQNRVEQLTKELAAMETVQSEAGKQRRAKAELESKLSETVKELNEAKKTLQHTENVLKQEQASAKRKEQDFALAIQARDRALKEMEKLKSSLDTFQLREKEKTGSLQQSLQDARTDHSKMASTLESVMISHGQLQVAVETLQTEMGKKDQELAGLRHERQSHKRSTEQTQREVARLQEQLVAMESAESNQLASLNVELVQASKSHSKMAAQLQEALATITGLQVASERLQAELDKREAQYHVLSETRQHEKEESQRARSELEEQLQRTQQQLQAARDSSQKKLTKEVGQLRQANADATSRALQLAKENKALQTRVDDLEHTVSKLKTRIGSQKSQLSQVRGTQQANRDLESKLGQIQDQLRELEATKADYAAKNRDQAQTIATFMDQMGGLQRELEGLSHAQRQESSQSRERMGQLEKEVEKGRQLEVEHTRLRQELKEMEERKNAAEEKLSEASNESLEISNHLQEAHGWFKSRYSSLQRALSEARQTQARLEQTALEQQQELTKERLRSGAQTRKAQEMIKASREALNQLANQAEIDQLETRTQMHNLAQRVQAEKDHATLTDQKMEKLLNTSAELVEELAMELDRSQSYGRL
ncbi:coiled-coil domain-containing protein 150-like [Diadema antillarum]|uniref:coiled-coil domain-containing protein 150-like n=1 Tax=Diadema antillarum TaxID=105358 RepID=UPI003A850485